MIRINLLPVREARRKADLRMQVMLLGASVGVGLLLCMGLQVSVQARIGNQRDAIVSKQNELKRLEATQKEVKRFQDEQREIESKLSVISQIERARTGPVRMLDDISTSIPNRVWLRSLSANAGALTLEGLSLDAEIVADFASRLEDSTMISSVELQETAVQEAAGLKLNRFKLKASYPYAQPAAAAAPNKGKGRSRARRPKQAQAQAQD